VLGYLDKTNQGVFSHFFQLKQYNRYRIFLDKDSAGAWNYGRNYQIPKSFNQTNSLHLQKLGSKLFLRKFKKKMATIQLLSGF
jgi:hypothetical protein